MKSDDVNIWLMVAVLITGVMLTVIFYYFSGTKRSFRHGHIFVLTIYVGFVFVLIADYAKKIDLVPNLYKKRLKEDKGRICQAAGSLKCDNFDCLEHIENTYDFHYLDDDGPNGDTCGTYKDWTTDNRVELSKCYKLEPSSPKTNVKSGDYYKTFALYVRDFFVKAAFNCCASDNFRNGYVNIESMNLAILMGCRFLDFEVYTIDGTPCVATSTNPNSYDYKESFNHLDLDYVLKHVSEKAMTGRGCRNYNDPLFLHFRVKTRVSKTYLLMARYIQKYFGETLIGPDFAQDFAKDESPFSLPLESTLGRVFVIFQNQPASAYFPEGALFNQYIYKKMGRDAKKLEDVITTWSGNHENVKSPDYRLREYLHVFQTIDKINPNELGDSEKEVANHEKIKQMCMFYPATGTKDNVELETYADVNNRIRTNHFFSLKGDRRSDKRSEISEVISKGALTQVVPVCVQAYQKDCKGQESQSLLVEWFNFFKSARYYTGKAVVHEDDIRATGLRQRIVKYQEGVQASTTVSYSNLNLSPKAVTNTMKNLVEQAQRNKP